MKDRFEIVLNKHGKIRNSRKYELMGLLNNMIEKQDEDYIFNFINFNRTLLKDETDYLSEIYNNIKNK